MNYSEEIYRKIKHCGVLSFSVEDTINHLYSDCDIAQLAIDLRDETTFAYIMYTAGLTSGKFALASVEFQIRNAEAEKANLELTRERLYHKKLLEIAGYDDERSI